MLTLGTTFFLLGDVATAVICIGLAAVAAYGLGYAVGYLAGR